MNNNGMIVYKEPFMTKVKKIFRNLFIRKKKTENKVDEIFMMKEKSFEAATTENFKNSIKANNEDTNIVIPKKDEFLNELIGNVEKLRMLSMDRLKKLEKYYESIIYENALEIKRLQELKEGSNSN